MRCFYLRTQTFYIFRITMKLSNTLRMYSTTTNINQMRRLMLGLCRLKKKSIDDVKCLIPVLDLNLVLASGSTRKDTYTSIRAIFNKDLFMIMGVNHGVDMSPPPPKKKKKKKKKSRRGPGDIISNFSVPPHVFFFLHQSLLRKKFILRLNYKNIRGKYD